MSAADNFKPDPQRILQDIFALKNSDGQNIRETMNDMVLGFQQNPLEIKDFSIYGVKTAEQFQNSAVRGKAFVELLKALEQAPEKISELNDDQRKVLASAITLIARTLKSERNLELASAVGLDEELLIHEALGSRPLPPDIEEKYGERFRKLLGEAAEAAKAENPPPLSLKQKLGQGRVDEEQDIAFWQDFGQKMVNLCSALAIPVPSKAAQYIQGKNGPDTGVPG